MVRKHPLVPDRVRTPPREGFSWVDRRFVREYAPGLSRDAVLLYFFFCAVSDKDGLSFWGDAAIAGRLRLDGTTLERARDELRRRELIAYAAPLLQVLSLPSSAVLPRAGSLESVGDVLRRLTEGEKL